MVERRAWLLGGSAAGLAGLALSGPAFAAPPNAFDFSFQTIEAALAASPTA